VLPVESVATKKTGSNATSCPHNANKKFKKITLIEPTT
jgi:hypothetical protein